MESDAITISGQESNTPLTRKQSRGSPIIRPRYRQGEPPKNKGKKLLPQALTRDELDTVMASFGHTKVGTRNRAMVALMARMGLKVGQVVRLQHDHYHAGSNVLTVPGIQGAADRVEPVDAVTRRILDEWMEFRDAVNPGALAPFFCTVSEGSIGEPIGTPYLRAVVHKHVKACGIRKRVVRKAYERPSRTRQTTGLGG